MKKTKFFIAFALAILGLFVYEVVFNGSGLGFKKKIEKVKKWAEKISGNK